MNRADRWLYGELRAIRDWRRDALDDRVAGSLERACAGLDALEAAGALSAAAASQWRAVFRRVAAGESRVVAGPEVSDRAEEFLGGLLDTLRPDGDEDDANAMRFQASLHLLSAVGAVDGRVWDGRLRERVGRPSEDEERVEELALNAGGTELDLVDVIAGPGEVRGGYRLVLVLRFADGVSFMLDKSAGETWYDEWPGWKLIDDVGTSYWRSRGGGSDQSAHISFRTPIPAQASWVRLSLEDRAAVSFRVRID